MKRTNNPEETKRIFMDLEVIRKSNDCPYIVRCYGFIITMVSTACVHTFILGTNR